MRRSHNDDDDDDAWDNPFTEKSLHTKNYHHPLQDECYDEDEDSNCRDEVVYNDDHLGGLLTLYKTRNKREVQDSTHSEQAQHEKVPIGQAASSSTARVTEEVTALKEAELYCRGATQFTGFEKQVEAEQLNNHNFDTLYNSGLHFTPCKQVDEEEVLLTPHISVLKRASESLDSLKVGSLVKDSWDRFVQEVEPVEDVQCSKIEECEKKIPQSSSALKKSTGASRQKLRFSFRQGNKPHFLKGKEDPGQRQNVSVLEKLQSLVEEDVSLVDEVDCLMRKKSEKLAFSECMPIGERLQVLFSESALSHMNGVNKSSRKKRPTSVPVADRLMLALDEENMPLKDTSNIHTEDSDVGDNPFVEECRGKKADYSLNERLQKALNDASEFDEGSPIHGQPYRPICGYAASLGRVLVQEKSRREKFLRALQTGHSLDDTAQSLEVQILTKTLEAYLATCTCKVCKAPQDWVNESRTLFQGELQHGLVTTIFSTRTNPSLDLDIGNVIRIYPPWNEIGDLTDFGKIIICTYYCAMEDSAS